jgi:predicted MFS family arabinose efflux permease
MSRDCIFAWVLGLHGLAMMIAFPLGPQQARLWHPGLPGIGALVAAFPIATVIAGLIARRVSRLPSEPRTLALMAVAGLLTSIFSTGYFSFFTARIIGGATAGVSVVALYRVLPTHATSGATKVAGRIIAFGMPVCLLAATAFDWRAVCIPICAGFAMIALRTTRRDESPSTHPVRSLEEAAPAALIATSALAFVSSSYLTVLSGFLVGNAGHTEFHIPGGLLTGALLSLIVPSLMTRVNARLTTRAVFAGALAASLLTLVCLLSMRGPLPAALVFGFIGCFLAVNTIRHMALTGLVQPRLRTDQIAAHQTHTYIAHCLGCGLGALCAGHVIHVRPTGGLHGMETLLGCALVATTLALVAGLSITQATASPAACPASAKSRWRVAASLVRSVRTSIIRNPGSPT